MDLFEHVHNYCERAGGDALLSEPLNAVSNISFFIAAGLLCLDYKKTFVTPAKAGAQLNMDTGLRRYDVRNEAAMLIFLIALVGTGSTFFHIFANKFAMLGDVIPIAMFTFYYLWVALRRLVQLDTIRTCIALAAFAAVSSQVPHLPPQFSFNGSASYFPCLLALLLIGNYLNSRLHPAAEYLLKAAALFTVSLIFRSLDMALCPHIPIGTHFLWHALNGAVLYLLTKPIIRVH